MKKGFVFPAPPPRGVRVKRECKCLKLREFPFLSGGRVLLCLAPGRPVLLVVDGRGRAAMVAATGGGEVYILYSSLRGELEAAALGVVAQLARVEGVMG